METAILNFWNWFAASHEAVRAAYDRNDTKWMVDQLTTRIRAIHPRLNWEMGPYHHPDRTLIISPSIRENLALTRRIVASAPTTIGWYFLHAKPPKVLNRLRMELLGVPGAAVNAAAWTYRLTAYNQLEFFDVDVFTDAGVDVSDHHLWLLACRLIESLVGESVFLERFADVKVYRPSDPLPAASRTPFPHLGRHIAHLLQPSE